MQTRKQWELFVRGTSNLAEWAGSWLVRTDRLCKHLHMTVTCDTHGEGRGGPCGSMSVCSYSANICCLWAVKWICIGCWFDSLITSLLHCVPLRWDHFPVWLTACISVVQHQFSKRVVIGSHVTQCIICRWWNGLTVYQTCISDFIYTTIILTKRGVEKQIRICTLLEICWKLNLIGFT